MMTQSQVLKAVAAVVAFSSWAIAKSLCSRRSIAREAYARAASVRQVLEGASVREAMGHATII
ncbi:hypothetical protein D3C85_1920940 [compost metagenome]